MKTITIQKKYIIQIFALVALLFAFNSCSETTENKLTINSESDSITKAIPHLIKNPIVPLEDTCLQPQYVLIPTQSSSKSIVTKMGETVLLTPPIVKKADFLSQMQNYTTDDGLALDNVEASIKDKKRDLWFFTHDGVVSNFDKKKLKSKKQKEILIESQDKSTLEQQEAYLDDFAEIWKNGNEQIDDILIIGIRF